MTRLVSKCSDLQERRSAHHLPFGTRYVAVHAGLPVERAIACRGYVARAPLRRFRAGLRDREVIGDRGARDDRRDDTRTPAFSVRDQARITAIRASINEGLNSLILGRKAKRAMRALFGRSLENAMARAGLGWPLIALARKR